MDLEAVKRQLQLDPMRPDERTVSPPTPTLTKASQKCKIALDTLRNFSGASLVQQLAAPEVYQAAQDLRSWILDVIESNSFSNKLAELQIRDAVSPLESEKSSRCENLCAPKNTANNDVL